MIFAIPILALLQLPPAGPQDTAASRPGGLNVAPVAPRANATLSPEELQKRLEEKLALPFLKRGTWFTDYDAALVEARKSGKLVFGYFTRSDIDSASCKSIEAGLLLDSKFEEWGRDYILFCHITTQLKERRHENLLGQKSGAGFPTIFFMDDAGTVITRHQGARSVDALNATAAQAKSLHALHVRSKNGDEEARLELLVKSLEGGLVRPAEIPARAREFKNLKPESQKLLDELLFEVELDELYRSTRGRDEEVAEAAQKVLQWYDSKRIPTRTKALDLYWAIVIDYARARKDAKAFELALSEQEKRWKDDPSGAGRIQALRMQYERIVKLALLDTLREKVKSGDAGAKKQLFLLEVELQSISNLSELKQRSAELKELTADESAKVEEWILDLEVREITGSVRDRGPAFEAAGKQLLQMAAAKRVPKGSESFSRFWLFVINYGAQFKDEAALEQAFTAIRERIATDPRLASLQQVAERQLAEIRKRTDSKPAGQK